MINFHIDWLHEVTICPVQVISGCSLIAVDRFRSFHVGLGHFRLFRILVSTKNVLPLEITKVVLVHHDCQPRLST